MISVLYDNILTKKLLSCYVSFFVGFVLLTTLIQPVNAADCLIRASKGHSSKQRCFGVSGWSLGKDCPNMELYWESKEEGGSNIFFRNPTGDTFKLHGGMAIFSSNCKYFWYTDFWSKHFQIYSTKTGKPIIKTIGEYAAWSLDGNAIYFFRTEKSRRQLWELNVIDKSENLIMEVQDYLPCFQQGDEAEWYPVNITKEGHVLWCYWVKDPEIERYTNSAKKLTIDAKRKKVIKIQHKDSCLCAPFEEDN